MGVIAPRELVKEHKSKGLKENKQVAKMGGSISKVARDELEKKLGKTVISKENSLPYQYIDDLNKIENK